MFDDLEHARFVTLEPSSTRLAVAPPPTRRGDAPTYTVRVQVRRSQETLYGLLMVLVPLEGEAGQPPESFGWVRHTRGARQFKDVAPGTYEVLVFDGTQGSWHGLSPNPLREAFTVRDRDVQVEVETRP